MHQQMGSPTLIDAMLSDKAGRNRSLEAIDKAVDWKRFEELLSRLHDSKTGRPSYPPLAMFKILLLQHWHDLSDPEMEELLGDRISFMRFVGIGMNEKMPDHSTISRFRSALAERKLDTELFAELERQIDDKGLIVKKGTILDATIVGSQARRPSYSAGRGAKSEVDADAAWGHGGVDRKMHFGYKAHIGMDEGTGIVRRAELTPANVSDTEVADGLVVGDEGAVYADKAYESKRRREWLQSLGIKDRIMHRSHRHQAALPHWQKVRNRLIGPRRRTVERVFGTLKRSYRYARVRYMGLERNRVEMNLKLMAYNLRKMVMLTA